MHARVVLRPSQVEGPCTGCSLYDASGGLLRHCTDLEPIAVTRDSSATASIADSNGSVSSSDGSVSFSHGAAAGAAVGARREAWVVAPERWFVFPSGSLGRSLAVSRVPPPRGADRPIVVESLSEGKVRASAVASAAAIAASSSFRVYSRRYVASSTKVL